MSSDDEEQQHRKMNQASEDDSESSDDEDMITTKKNKRKERDDSASEKDGSKKKKKKESTAFIEQEASESEDADSGDDSDEEGENNYEQDGFLVHGDDDDDDDNSSEEETRVRRRKKKKRKEKQLKRLKQKDEDQLDDEDIALIQENLGITQERSDELISDSEEDEFIAPKSKKKQDKTSLSRQMFGDSDDSDGDDDGSSKAAARRKNQYRGDELDYESDDMDEFIVEEDGKSKSSGGSRRQRQKPGSMAMTGPSAYQMDEAEELFGDLEGFMEATGGAMMSYRGEGKDGNHQLRKNKRADLIEKYEPSVLKENMMTEQDDVIRKLDLPERFQEIYADKRIPGAEERNEEAEWMYSYLRNSLSQHTRGEVVGAIDNVLRFYHEQHVEPVFVRHYLKEYWEYAGLMSSHLQLIFELDQKWDKLDRKKSTLKKALGVLMEQAQGNSSESLIIESRFRESYEINIAVADENQIRDWSEFIALDALHSSSSDRKTSSAKNRRPMKRDLYRICRKANLRPLMQKFTMKTSVLGALASGQMKAEDIIQSAYKNPEDSHESHHERRSLIPTPVEETPEGLAMEYLCQEFLTEDEVLQGACYLASFEIAAEPNVRQLARDFYRQHAVFSTTTTKKGKEDIDEFHYCHGLQYVHKMPLMDVYRHESYLKITRGLKEGYLTMTTAVNESEQFVQTLASIYLDPNHRHECSSSGSEQWNMYRQRIVEDAVMKFLFPSLERELKDELLVKAREKLTQECGEMLYDQLMVRPYEPLDGSSSSEQPYVLGIWVEDSHRDSKAYFAALDTNGELVDKIQALCHRGRDHIQKLSHAIYTFLDVNRHVQLVAINTSAGIKCMDMGQLLDEVRTRLLRDDESRFGNHDGQDYLHISLLRDDVSRMFARSDRGEMEFPDEPEGMRSAISLGRYCQNPLSEFCALWDFRPLREPTRGQTLLYLNIHPLQKFVVKSALVREYERVFIKVVNQCGVDLNLATNHRHASYQVQFIAGLGPTKAVRLLDQIRSHGHVERRDELLSNEWLLPNVYRNAAGFLRIRERDTLKDSTSLNPLDDTRIHPESYFMAVKMCGDANDKTTLDLYDPDKYSYVVEDTMFQSASTIKSALAANSSQLNYQGLGSSNGTSDQRLPESEIHDALAELDLQAYAGRLEEEEKGQKLLTLDDIKTELRYPHFDVRRKFTDLTSEDLFFVINGQTRYTLRIGMVLPCTLMYPVKDIVVAKTESGIRVNIRKDQLPNYMTYDYLRNTEFPRGTPVNAKVVDFFLDDHGRALAMRCDDDSICNVSSSIDLHSGFVSSYCDVEHMTDDYQRRLEKLCNREPLDLSTPQQRAMKGGRKKRQIKHPSFQNVNCKGAITFLKDQPMGEAVFRPSRQGSDHLTLSWKVQESLYRHWDITELDKPGETRLGEKLVLKDETFDDLDEILARFISPMNELVDDVSSHEKYRSTTKDQVSEELVELKRRNPKSIPYLFRFNLEPERVGTFAITFVANKTPHSRHVEIRPQGFRFFGEKVFFPDLKKTINHFKAKALAPPRSSGGASSQSRYPPTSTHPSRASHHHQPPRHVGSDSANVSHNRYYNQGPDHSGGSRRY